MDAKITKKRLGRMLSYDWLKIVGLAAAFIVFWSLIFTVSATRITPAQQFTVFNHFANVSLDYGSFNSEYESMIDNGVFSYEIIETDVIDLTTAGDNIYTMCDTRFTTGQGDMMFIPHVLDNDKMSEGISISYLESFFSRYGGLNGYIQNWDDYLYNARIYLNEYFNGDYVNGSLNQEKAERDFRARVKANKDKRFKKEKHIQQGVKDEFARLEKYRGALLTFEGYLNAGLIKFETVVYKDSTTGETYYNETTGEVFLQGNYALNICPDESKMNNLKNRVFYSKLQEDGTVKYTSQNMCVMLFSLPDMDQDYQYETLSYINTVIAASLTA